MIAIRSRVRTATKGWIGPVVRPKSWDGFFSIVEMVIDASTLRKDVLNDALGLFVREGSRSGLWVLHEEG